MCEQVNRNTCFLLTYLQEWLDRTHQRLKKKQNLMYHPIQIYGITHQILFIFPKTTIGGNLVKILYTVTIWSLALVCSPVLFHHAGSSSHCLLCKFELFIHCITKIQIIYSSIYCSTLSRHCTLWQFDPSSCLSSCYLSTLFIYMIIY